MSRLSHYNSETGIVYVQPPVGFDKYSGADTGGGSSTQTDIKNALLRYWAGLMTFDDLKSLVGDDNQLSVLLSTPLSAAEQQTVTNLRGSSANLTPPLPAGVPGTKPNGPSASALLDLYKANPNGSTTYQDVVNAYKADGFNDQQAKDTIDAAISTTSGGVTKVAGLDVNAPAVQLIPGAGQLPAGTSEADIVQSVLQGQTTLERAYNTIVASGKSPDYATNFLQTNAKAYGWTPKLPQAQPFASTNGIDPNAVAQPTQNGGILGSIAQSAQNIAGSSTVGTAPAPAAPTYTGDHADFYNTYGPAAQYAQQKYGLDPSIVLASGASESNWGNAPGYMMFGIKGTGTAGSANLATHEVVNGKSVNVNDNFRQYNSPEEAVDGFMQFLQDNSRYAPALANFNKTGDTAQLFKDINAAGYATSPTWADSILKLANTTKEAIGQGAGAGGSTATTAGGTSPSGGLAATTSGGWVTNPDGTTSYVPPVEKSQMTPQEQLLYNQQQAAANQGILKNQQTSAIAAYQAQHPNAKLYDLGKGDGSFKVEDPSAPQGSANTWTVAFDPSTGTMQEGGYAVNPAVSTLSANGVFGNTAPTTGVLNGNQIANGTEATRALLAIDPAMAGESFAAAHGGRPGTLQEIQAWLGTSTGTNQSQDYADTQQNLATLAATGHTMTDYTAQGGVGTNTPINLAKSLGSRAASITPLNPTQQLIYQNDPALLNRFGIPDAYGVVGDTKYPSYSTIPFNQNNPTQGATIARAFQGQGETQGVDQNGNPIPGTGLGVSQSGNPLGINTTGQPGDTTFSAAAAKVGGQAFLNATQDNSGDVTQTADWQSGYSAGQSDKAAGNPPRPDGTDAYRAGYVQGYNAAGNASTKASQYGFNPNIVQPGDIARAGYNAAPVNGGPAVPQGSRTPVPVTPPTPITPPAPVVTPDIPEPKKYPVYFGNGGSIAVKLSPSKARKILSDGKIRGKPITSKQQRFFGAVASGSVKKMSGGGQLVTNEPMVMIGMHTGQPKAVVGEKGSEMINVTPLSGAVPLGGAGMSMSPTEMLTAFSTDLRRRVRLATPPVAAR